MHRYALRDDQWDKIKDFLPGREGHVGGTAAGNRLFVDAVIYPLSHGHPMARSIRALRSQKIHRFRTVALCQLKTWIIGAAAGSDVRKRTSQMVVTNAIA
jgi:hypothetical protein